MDNDILVFWFVILTCASGLIASFRRARVTGKGWIGIQVAILFVVVASALFHIPALIYVALAMWLFFVLLPGLIGKSFRRHILKQDYAAAHRLARIISWLHPMDGWPQQPELIRALDLAKRGEIAQASEIFNRFRNVKSLTGLSAIISFYRMTSQWEEFRDWERGQAEMLEQYPQFLPSLLRVCGEIGDLQGMLDLYARKKAQIAKMPAPDLADQCRLMLFAFCGRRQLVEQLFTGQLSVMPAATHAFWLATADMAAGNTDSARHQLETLLPDADPSMRLAIERRLSHALAVAEPLPTSAIQLVQNASVEQTHDLTFGKRIALFSPQALFTLVLIALNLAMFLLEILFGGSTEMNALYRLGAMYGPAVHAGEWWRLLASLFLHFGLLHLAMNMLALAWLGPFVEYAMGRWRFLLTYLLAGIGSMGIVMTFATGENAERLIVGASGCIMGLIGATGALMLRAWWKNRVLAAKTKLLTVVTVILMQTVFDSVIPQVSMTAHLSGALIGFLSTLALRDRFKTSPQTQPGTQKT